MTATFLPRNAALIVYYDATGGIDFGADSLARNHQPARLDWDLLNNAAAHLRVHWLPVQGMDDKDGNPGGLELFVKLVQHEVAILRRLREEDEND